MSTKHKFTFSVFIVLFLLVFVVVSYAGSKGSPTEIDNCTVITSPGSYDVSMDLPDKDGLLPSGNCIELEASSVVLNLNDHSIIGSGGGDGITDGGMPQSDITIRQGTITGFETAINLSASIGNIVEYVRVSANSADGISVGEQSVARHNVAIENDRGLVMTCPANAIGNSAWDNTSNDYFLNDSHLCSLSEGLNSFGSSGGIGASCISVGLTDCSGSCADLLKDEVNCGACAVACGAGELCINGACTLSCQVGLVECAGTCTDISKDEDNCGGCGNVCGDGEFCVLGSCESPVTGCELHAISPTSAAQSELPIWVTVWGSGFEPGSQVLLAGEYCETIVIGSNSLTFEVPAGVATLGAHTVTVEKTDSSTCAYSAFFVAEAPPPPVITGIFPIAAYQNELPKQVKVFGSEFDPDSQIIFGTESYPTSFIASTELRFSIPAGTAPGRYDVTVVNPYGVASTLPDAFEVLQDCPVIAAINPTSRQLPGFPVNVLVSGSGFEPESQVLFGDELCDAIVISSGTLYFSAPISPPGTYDVTVVNPDGCEYELPDAFEVLPEDPPLGDCPTVSSINPSFAYQSDLPISVDVWGSEFDPESQILFEGESYPFTFISESQLNFTLTAGVTPGVYRLTVINPGGCSDVLMNAFVLE